MKSLTSSAMLPLMIASDDIATAPSKYMTVADLGAMVHESDLSGLWYVTSTCPKNVKEAEPSSL